VKWFIASGTVQQRVAAYKGWEEFAGPSVLLVNYHGLVRDWDYGIKKEAIPLGAKLGTQPTTGRGLLDAMTLRFPKLTVIFDECTAFKNPSTKTHQTCKFLSQRAKKVWGLTATLLRNNLMEGFGIYKVIRPETFSTKNAFLNAYCITELQRIKGGGKIPIVVGYRNLEHFRKTIDPFFYGRPKHAVSTELPALTTREVTCELSPVEDKKYAEALAGILEMGDGELRDYTDTKQLTSLIYAQEVCNSLGLLKFEDGDEIGDHAFEGRSSKESALVNLITEEFDGEKVIIYTRFEKLVGRLQKILAKEGVKSVAITGKVNKASDRKKAQDQFQDLNSKVHVIFITDAGSEAINLQSASAMVFFDTPWSWGNYVQCLDMKTEVLTQRGFLRSSEITEDDLVAALDPGGSSEIRWCSIKSKVVRPLAKGEEMYELKSQGLDIRVTGGHRMLFKRQSSETKRWPSQWSFETAKEMSEEQESYRIPLSGMEQTQGVPLTDPELQFLGWVLSDRVLHKRLCKFLRECPKDGFDWNWKDWSSLEAYLDKDLSHLLESLDHRQLGVFLEALHLGKGAKQTWDRISNQISIRSKLFADRLQSLCIRRGYSCNLQSKSDGKTHILTIRNTQIANLKPQGRPGFVRSATGPNEHVWCVENELGTLITRRNGKVVILGNCLGRMIRIGSPYQNVLAIHLIARRPGHKSETIDHKVIQKLRRKKGLIDQIIGEAAVGALKFERGEGEVKELLRSIREDV
jgi:hypothetical protein